MLHSDLLAYGDVAATGTPACSDLLIRPRRTDRVFPFSLWTPALLPVTRKLDSPAPQAVLPLASMLVACTLTHTLSMLFAAVVLRS